MNEQMNERNTPYTIETNHNSLAQSVHVYTTLANQSAFYMVKNEEEHERQREKR